MEQNARDVSILIENATRRAFVAIAFVALLSGCRSRAFHSVELNGAEAAPIVATLADGKTFELSSLRGRVTLLTFGYTHCPDVCPMTLSKLRKLYDELGPAGDQLASVFVSVDPQRDSIVRVRDYVAPFDSRIVGLHLEPEPLLEVQAAYRVSAVKRIYEASAGPGRSTGEHYAIEHTAGFFALDRQGRVRLLIALDAPMEHVLADVKRLIDE